MQPNLVGIQCKLADKILPCDFIQLSCWRQSRQQLKTGQGFGCGIVQNTVDLRHRYAVVLGGKKQKNCLQKIQIWIPVCAAVDLTRIHENLNGFGFAEPYKCRLVGPSNFVPGSLIRNTGDRQAVPSLECGYRTDGFRAIDAVGNQGR